jgi:hypothetical protein
MVKSKINSPTQSKGGIEGATRRACLCDAAASGDQVIDQDAERHDQQDVDEASGKVEAEA